MKYLPIICLPFYDVVTPFPLFLIWIAAGGVSYYLGSLKSANYNILSNLAVPPVIKISNFQYSVECDCTFAVDAEY